MKEEEKQVFIKKQNEKVTRTVGFTILWLLSHGVQNSLLWLSSSRS